MDALPDAGTPWTDLTLTMDALIGQARRWVLGIALFTLLPFWLIWGLPDWPAGLGFIAVLEAIILYGALALVIYLISAALHEVIHVAGMLAFGRVPWRSIRFGSRLREGVIYVHTDRPMSLRAYRGVLVLPALVQGVGPAVVGLALGAGWVLVYGFVMLVSAVGDLVMLHRLHGLPGDALARDHPEKIGCQVQVPPSPRTDVSGG